VFRPIILTIRTTGVPCKVCPPKILVILVRMKSLPPKWGRRFVRMLASRSSGELTIRVTSVYIYIIRTPACQELDITRLATVNNSRDFVFLF